ncbi:MAG: hypothetical protein KA314_22655 [Chloroflexi bacterium]|nr:hypothetical protein [Chloroflexota bacterium]MBP8058645.1 hypothetical protein [Chloroflexota bacterium]
MPILHMETDVVGEVAQGVALLAGLVNEEGSTMRRAVWGVVNSWQGGAAADFEWEVNHLLTTLSRLEEEALLLGQRLRREIEEWEDVDRQLSGSSNMTLPGWSPSPFPLRPGPEFLPDNPQMPYPFPHPEEPFPIPLPDIIGKPDEVGRVVPLTGTATPPIIPPDHPATSDPMDKPGIASAKPNSEKPNLATESGTVTPPIIPPDHPSANPADKPRVSPVKPVVENPEPKIGTMRPHPPIDSPVAAADPDDKPLPHQRKTPGSSGPYRPEDPTS